MRYIAALLLGLTGAFTAVSQAPKLNPRYGLDYNPTNFPQATPPEALTSALRAIREKRVDYLLAHLTDPEFVDQRVQTVHKGKFEDFVKEVANKLLNDPDAVKLLQRFAQEGEWETTETTASAKLKDVKERVYCRKVGERWFLENEKKKTEKENQ